VKKIFQKKYKINIDTNIKIHPEWYFYLWDEGKIVNLMKLNPKLINTYNKFKYMHQKIDFAKYVILYYYGGIYIDMDAYTIKNLDTLIEDNSKYDLIVSKLGCNMLENYMHCANKFCINNGIIYAKPQNIVLKKMIQHIILHNTCSNITNRTLCIEQTTGPKVFTKIIIKNMNDKIKLLEPKYWEPCVFDMYDIVDDTYIVHKHEGSWHSEWTKKLFLFYLHNKNIIYLVIVMVIIMVVFKYMGKN